MKTMAPQAHLHNRLFEDLSPGDCASLQRSVTAADLQLLAIAAGDDGPPPQPAGAGPASASLPGAALVTALLAALVNTRLPGPGSVLLGQTLGFGAAVVTAFVGFRVCQLLVRCFRRPKQLTPEEEEEVRRENQWAFD